MGIFKRILIKSDFYRTAIILFILLLLVISINGYAQKKFTFSANEPIGKAKGICPGRVTLAHDPKVAKWDGVNEHWWDEGQIDQERLDRMYDLSICSLANANTAAILVRTRV